MDDGLQERYRALLRSARSLFSLTNLNDVVEHIIRHSIEMMSAEACSMYLPDAETEELVIYSAKGEEDKHFHTARIPWDKGIAGTVFQKKEMIRIDDAANDSRVLRSVSEGSGFVTRALITIPMLDRGNTCVGVLQAINPKGRPSFTDDDIEIFEALAGIVSSALIRLERERKAADEARMARELTVAQDIQRSFLPPEEFTLKRAELRVKYQPARTIGGDFYAALAWPNDQLLVAIGDVSGKGIPAALTTAQVTTEMNALTGQFAGNLQEWVRSLNAVLCGRLAAGRFVATTFLLYNPTNSTMEVLCAGQYAPWRWDEELDQWQPLEINNGPPLGIFASQRYETQLFPCGPGEKWLLFSDGITEGRNRKKEEYGDERLLASLKSSGPSRILDAAWRSWSSFVNVESLHDDACLALLATRPEPVMDLPSRPESCKSCRNFVEGWSRLAGFPDVERGQIVLALDEAFTNILRHTYKGETHHLIQVRGEVSSDSLTFRIRDYGPQIELGKLKGRALEDVKPGGLGLHLLKATFPVVEYTACNPGTELRLVKPLPAIS